MQRKHGDQPILQRRSILEELLHHDALAAGLLLAAAALAFVAANVPALAHYYHALWHIDFGFSFWGMSLIKPLHVWINDGLMSIFFFVVGLEIKRELFFGELASMRKAALPIAAAIGGMLAPALIYFALNQGTDTARGWGIPMATDIAFSAGVLGLLIKRIPPALPVFLIALAIVDDLVSILVIAVFYTETIHLGWLVMGGALIAVSFILSRLGVRNAFVFFALAAVVWLDFFESGVHATVAGVLLAFTIPARAEYETPHFVQRIKELLGRFEQAEDHVNPHMVNDLQQTVVREIERECVWVEAPLQRLESKLHPLSVFLIMPLFAFANSGVELSLSHATELLATPVALGVMLGLVLGKQAGIMLCSWVTVRLGFAALPGGVRWLHVYGLAWLAGIGFTMSLFIGELAFAGHGAEAAHAAGGHLAEAKLGTLAGSIIAGAGGTAILWAAGRKQAAQATNT
jgi:NhaA family Na+:H+ antiporter